MIRSFATAFMLSIAPAAFAQTYIVPDGNCGAVTLHATRGSDFPNLGEAIDAGLVETAYVFLPKKRVAVTPVAGSRSLDLKTEINEGDGVVMAAVDFVPVSSGNETRSDHAKTLIFCGDTPMVDWQRSTGLGLEIYPQGWNGPRPQLKAGDLMRFIAVDKATNKMLRDLPMELHRAGHGRVATGVAHEHGGMTFEYPEPGLYLVTATYRRPDPERRDHWLVDTSTLTFEVK